MPLFYSIPLFLGSLALLLGGSMLLARVLSRLGRRLSIPGQLLGFITALGADSPEISSTIVALLAGKTDVGVGVVFGSNLFNLATLLGVTAVIAGRISIRRNAVLLDGSVGVLVTGCAMLLVLGATSPALIAGLLLTLLAVYVLLLALPGERLDRLPLPSAWKRFVLSAARETEEHGQELQEAEEEEGRAEVGAQGRSRHPVDDPPESMGKLSAQVLGALAVIVLSSIGLVRSTSSLTAGWLPEGLLGTLVIAALTGIPNLYTATRLALRHRGSAVMTEAMNSNSLNILIGLSIPSLLFGGMLAHTAGGYLDTAWLFAMTVGVVCLLAASKGLSRRQGVLVILAYLAFVAVRVWLSVVGV